MIIEMLGLQQIAYFIIRRAFDLNSITESPSVSSMNNGAFSVNALKFLSSLFQSSLSSCPLISFLPSISQTFDNKRFANCTSDISKEKNAIGIPWSIAMFLANESANAVFPMAGLPAIITRSDFCQPHVMSSSL